MRRLSEVRARFGREGAVEVKGRFRSTEGERRVAESVCAARKGRVVRDARTESEQRQQRGRRGRPNSPSVSSKAAKGRGRGFDGSDRHGRRARRKGGDLRKAVRELRRFSKTEGRRVRSGAGGGRAFIEGRPMRFERVSGLEADEREGNESGGACLTWCGVMEEEREGEALRCACS